MFTSFLRRSLNAIASLALFVWLPALAVAADYPAHPLDPLSRDEISAAVEMLRNAGRATDDSRYATVVLREPPKSEVLGYSAGSAFRREALVVVFERSVNKTFEAVVDLNK